jgi:hypothetical protein
MTTILATGVFEREHQGKIAVPQRASSIIQKTQKSVACHSVVMLKKLAQDRVNIIIQKTQNTNTSRTIDIARIICNQHHIEFKSTIQTTSKTSLP